MFTLFDLIRLLAIAAGGALLGKAGWDAFGIVGCLAGIPLGFALGAIMGQLPLAIVLKLMSRRFDRMTNEQLVGELHAPECLTPNIVLLELNRRGYNIRQELPFVQSLLASVEMHRRTAGWAALTSAFPELVNEIPGYNPTAATAECQLKSMPLLNATEHIKD